MTMFTGCGTLANGRGWGQGATLCPGWERAGKTALNAALEPETLAPARHDSFPSSHASKTSVCDTLASRNIDYLYLPVEAQYGLKVGFATLTVATGWARIEAKKHYPSDVLAGMALGHFIVAFNDAFLDPDSSPKSLLTGKSFVKGCHGCLPMAVLAEALLRPCYSGS